MYPPRTAAAAPSLELSSFAEAFTAFFRDPVEVTGALLSGLSIFLLARQKVVGWPVGIAATVLYLPVFFHARLYADLGLYVIFLVFQAYGWYAWLRGGPGGVALGVRRAPRGALVLLLGLAALLNVAMGYSLARWTDQDLAFWDSFTTSFSLAGQVMQARKWLENWLLWLVVDAIAAGIYFAKGLYPTMVLYLVFLVLAAMGYAAWRRDLEGQQAPGAP